MARHLPSIPGLGGVDPVQVLGGSDIPDCGGDVQARVTEREVVRDGGR